MRKTFASPDDVDFDAPLAARIAVGNVESSGAPTTGSVVTPAGLLDEECGLGATTPECVDFDSPLARRVAVGNIEKGSDENIDFDAPLAARAAVGNVVASGSVPTGPVVTPADLLDEECALGATTPECIDQDAPLDRRVAVGNIEQK